ncbi:MAG TPA: hypothetical protein VFH62_00725 [Dehalococcoidia bacterium]|nr:hypothetical protein [Dehalococcoidia bacterium]
MAIVGYGERGISGVTEGQREAIEEAMKLILEEDQDRGIGPDAQFECPGCHETRGEAGAVTYEDIRLCNACATRFEVERTARQVRSSAEYVRRRTQRTA